MAGKKADSSVIHVVNFLDTWRARSGAGECPEAPALAMLAELWRRPMLPAAWCPPCQCLGFGSASEKRVTREPAPLGAQTQCPALDAHRFHFCLPRAVRKNLLIKSGRVFPGFTASQWPHPVN